MSFYRTFIAAVAAMGLASVAFAADTNATDAAKDPAAVTQPAATNTADAQQASDAAQAEKLNLNKASAKELAKVKGLNPNKAKAIVAYRKKHGDFKSVDDLKEVKGFKKLDEKTIKDIQDQLTIG
jgi:competence protein ComEA